MIDPFVLLAPVLLLAVVALLRFVGCDIVFRIDEVPTTPTSNPLPVIDTLDPPSATAGDPGLDLRVTGSNFVTGVTVTFGATPTSVTPVAGTEIKVTVPATAPELANPGPVTVTVTNPTPGGGPASATFTIFPLVTVTFSPDPSGTPGPLPVPYKNLNFDANWNWERGIPQDPLNHIFLVSGSFSGTFSFVGPSGPRLLKRIKVSWGSATPGTGTVNISDDNSPQQTASLTFMNGQTLQTVETKWTKTATTITVSFPVADTLTIDEIDYQGPA